MTLHHGDCLDVMAATPEFPNCVRRYWSSSHGAFLHCRRRATVEYVVRADSGMTARPWAGHCDRHVITPPDGYVRRAIG